MIKGCKVNVCSAEIMIDGEKYRKANIMVYITCKELALGYEDGVVAEHINFVVDQGDYLCVVGENGAGKSTLIKTLLHLIRPISGELIMDDGILPQEIGYLPQQTMVQRDFPASVWEIVLSGALTKCGRRPWYGRAEKETASRNLERMGMAEFKTRCYRNLSGGQQQRVLLARALCATSKLLLLDEPVTGLDPKTAEEFYGLLKSLNQEGLAIIMVSHDIRTAVSQASHVLHIDKENSFYGTREEYLQKMDENIP